MSAQHLRGQRRPSAVCGQVLGFCSCRRVGPHRAHMCPCGGTWRGEGSAAVILALPTAHHPDVVLLYPPEKDVN